MNNKLIPILAVDRLTFNTLALMSGCHAG